MDIFSSLLLALSLGQQWRSHSKYVFEFLDSIECQCKKPMVYSCSLPTKLAVMHKPIHLSLRATRLSARASCPYLIEANTSAIASRDASAPSSLTKVVLKNKLRAAGLKVSGSKAELLARLLEQGPEQKASVVDDCQAGMEDSTVVNAKRIRSLNKVDDPKPGTVLYWMSRDQRCEDNWALLHAQELAINHNSSLHVVFCLVPVFLDATIRQFDFMLKGLREVEKSLSALGIPFHLRLGLAAEQVPLLCSEIDATRVVCDMSPLRVPLEWCRAVAKACTPKGIAVIQVDAHNIVPVWCASDKQEYAARTIRKRITTKLAEFLTDIPALKKHPYPVPVSLWPKPVDWMAAEATLQVDRTVEPVEGIIPGAEAAQAKLNEFIMNKLSSFHSVRNDPNIDGCSGLSPYLHFGQIAAQRCICRVQEAADKHPSLKLGAEAFIEEAVIRRELSDNFCFYNEFYDSIDGAASWAQATLKEHEGDKRDHVYSEQILEAAQTHDDLWNAAQLQMVRDGKMHGFLRMYWAKKILEWTPSPKEALAIAIRLNDKYELDGRDPNGYVGCMWSICGIHDQGWAERQIFGKIRFMNYAGCKKKMSIPKFVARYQSQAGTLESTQRSQKKRKVQ